MIRRLLRFAVVGSVGFCIDAGVLLLLVRTVLPSPLPARVISFVTAATVTFALNHVFTFRAAGAMSLQRWATYLATTALGAGINIGIYRLWVLAHGSTVLHLTLGTALGSLVAMAVNYSLSSALVFRSPRKSALPLD